MKYLKSYENYKTGIFNYKSQIYELFYTFNDNVLNIDIIKNGSKYDNLNVIVPDSKKLDKGCFYLNPDINKDILNILIEQGFISPLKIYSIAGDKKTEAYSLNFKT